MKIKRRPRNELFLQNVVCIRLATCEKDKSECVCVCVCVWKEVGGGVCVCEWVSEWVGGRMGGWLVGLLAAVCIRAFRWTGKRTLAANTWVGVRRVWGLRTRRGQLPRPPEWVVGWWWSGLVQGGAEWAWSSHAAGIDDLMVRMWTERRGVEWSEVAWRGVAWRCGDA